MNEMYNTGLGLHTLTTVAILAIIFINLFFLISKNDLKKYKKLSSVFLQPLTFSVYGTTVFTGVIMMAAKHLEFSVANILMIVVSIIFILLEVKRLKSLNYLSLTKEHAFNAYKPMARTILQVEFAVVALMSLGMWYL